MSEQRRAVVKNADMSDEMQQDAVDCATAALSKYGIEKDVAAHIKKEFDKKYHPTWHCIVGRNFGSTLQIYFFLSFPSTLRSSVSYFLSLSPNRQLRDARDQALYLLLPWPGRYPPLQVGIISPALLLPLGTPTLVRPRQMRPSPDLLVKYWCLVLNGAWSAIDARR